MRKIYFFIGLFCIFWAVCGQYADIKMVLLEARPLVAGEIDSLFIKEKIIGNVPGKQHCVRFAGDEQEYWVDDFLKDGSQVQFSKGESVILMESVLTGVRGVEKEYRMFSSKDVAHEYYSLQEKRENTRNSYLLATLGVIFLVAAGIKEYCKFRKNRKNC